MLDENVLSTLHVQGVRGAKFVYNELFQAQGCSLQRLYETMLPRGMLHTSSNIFLLCDCAKAFSLAIVTIVAIIMNRAIRRNVSSTFPKRLWRVTERVNSMLQYALRDV